MRDIVKITELTNEIISYQSEYRAVLMDKSIKDQETRNQRLEDIERIIMHLQSIIIDLWKNPE